MLQTQVTGHPKTSQDLITSSSNSPVTWIFLCLPLVPTLVHGLLLTISQPEDHCSSDSYHIFTNVLHKLPSRLHVGQNSVTSHWLRSYDTSPDIHITAWHEPRALIDRGNMLKKSLHEINWSAQDHLECKKAEKMSNLNQDIIEQEFSWSHSNRWVSVP